MHADTPSLQKPRLLVLHGGGTNARIMASQCRALARQLDPYFRLVYANGPFLCAPGPGVDTVYASHGPFRRWLRWLPEHPPVDDEDARSAVQDSLADAISADNALGATGDWVGVLGFSQGGKIAASLLYDAQRRAEQSLFGGLGDDEGPDFQFAVLIAARGPLVSLSQWTRWDRHLCRAGEITAPSVPGEEVDGARISRPTVHVHGLADPGIDYHRALLQEWSEGGDLVEWDGDHRVPIRKGEVERVVRAVLRAAKKAGVDVGPVG